MKLRRSKLFLLVISFVLLFLVDRFHFNLELKVAAEKKAVIDSARAEMSRQNSIATSSKTHPPTSLRDGATLGKLSSQGESPLPAVGIAAAGLSRGELKGEYYKVAKVVDGDTIDIIMNGRTERLRLIGVNTPEVVDPRKTVECFGREASDNAKKLLSGQEVRVEADATQDDRDKYGRLLRYVWRADGLFYNLEAIKGGFAYEYTYQLPYIYQQEFKVAQKYAEENKLGLWADGVCGKKNIAPAVVGSSTKSGCVIKGNIGADNAKIYHLPECSYYKQTVINESQGEKWFCMEEEAVAAGWRKAKNCP